MIHSTKQGVLGSDYHLEEVVTHDDGLMTRELVVDDPYQGIAALMATCHEPGYRLKKLDRRGNKVTVIYEKIS